MFKSEKGWAIQRSSMFNDTKLKTNFSVGTRLT